MLGSIYPSMYKNVLAVAMESDQLVVKFLPGYGGKMASLVYKSTGREFLAQKEGREYKELSYDGCYVESECSGFDDMFPTIDRMFYPEYPWKRVEMPDHGEVCGLPWEWGIEDNALVMSVHGVRFPYKLEKRIRFLDEARLVIVYKAVNLSNFDLDFLWASHLMIHAEEGGRILLPYAEGSPATCAFSDDPDFGARGYKLEWPVAVRADGKVQALDVTGRKNPEGNSYKYYFDQKIPEGWCAYRYASDHTQLKIAFPTDAVPYFGVWMNEGSFHHLHNLALEACTATFDSPDLARRVDQFSVLKAKSQIDWYLQISVEV